MNLTSVFLVLLTYFKISTGFTESGTILGKLVSKKDGKIYCLGSFVTVYTLMTSCTCVGQFNEKNRFLAHNITDFFVNVHSQDLALSRFSKYTLCHKSHISDAIHFNLGAIHLDRMTSWVLQRINPMMPPTQGLEDLEIVLDELEEKAQGCIIFGRTDENKIVGYPTNLSQMVECTLNCKTAWLCDYINEMSENFVRCAEQPTDFIPGSPVLCNDTVWGIIDKCDAGIAIYTPLDVNYEYYFELVGTNENKRKINVEELEGTEISYTLS
ncbi:uncharacterized protein LOC112127487 [Cimex lectularius]|uniref:Trypsin-like serine protease n=1 Tax=Cimex lectularius TaxID=79782 RepID=A0A8I6TMK9_CIMLE|nr:uncharacterized protein LOC112127487 [Cimex lectularius]